MNDLGSADPRRLRLRTTDMSTVAYALGHRSLAYGLGQTEGHKPTFGTVVSETSRPMQPNHLNPQIDDLLALVANGDTRAFSRLYDLTSDMVFGLALRVIKAPALAEEVAQEVYLLLWERAGDFDPSKGKAKSWIATLAHRRAVDAVRRAQSSRNREGRALPDLPPADVAESAIESDERARMRQALSALTDLQWEAIELAYFQGLTYREVAEKLDAPLGTVKSRMRDGLLRLRDTMGQDHG